MIAKKIMAFFESPAHKSYNYLSFFRISTGLIAMVDMLSMAADFKFLFSKNQTIIPQELAYVYSGYFDYLQPFYEFLKAKGLYEFYYNNVVWAYLLLLLFLIIGLFSRISASLALILQLLIFKSFDDYNYGYDTFLTMSLFYCIVFPVGTYSSIDNLIKREKKPNAYRLNYAKVLQWHLCVVYCFAGLPKILECNWWNGKAMWKALSGIHHSYYLISPYILIPAGIVVLFTETFYPVLMNIPYTRKITLFFILSMHIGIALMMNLFIFSAMMIVLNITAWYDVVPFSKYIFNKKQAKIV